jgi:hypothetical protein
MRRRALSCASAICFCLALAQVSISPRAARAEGKDEAPAKTAAAPDLKGSFLNALPKETTILLRVANMKSLVAKFKSSPAYALKDNADVKALLARADKETSEGLAGAKKELGFDPVEFLLSIDGEWILAVGNLDAVATAVGESLSVGQAPQNLTPEMFPVVIAADASANQDKVRERLDKIFALAEKKGAKRETADWKGGKITRLSHGGPASGPAKIEPPTGKDNKAEKEGSGDSEKDKKGTDGDKKGTDGDKKGTKDSKKGSGFVATESDDAKDKDSKKDKDAEKDGADADGTVSEDGAPKEAPVSLYVGEMAGRIYFSPSRAFLEGCMQKTDSAGPDALASNALFQETHKMTGAGDIHMFVNVKQLTTSIGNALSTTFFAFFWQKFDALFFGKTFNNVGLVVSLEEAAIREAIFAHNSGASDGILGVFKSQPFPVAAPAAVPADSQSFSSVAFNPEQLGKIIKDVIQTAMAFQGQAQDVDALAEAQIGVKLSDLVAGLGKRLHYFAGAPKADNPFANLNYILELRDEAPIKKLLKKLTELFQGDLQSEKFKDRDLYSVDTGNFGVTFAAADKLFVVSGSRAAVEKVINRTGTPGPSIGDSEEFKKAAAGLPASVSLLGFTSQEYMKGGLKALIQPLKDAGDPDNDAIVGALGALGEILGSSISYGVWNDAGMLTDGRMFYKKK